VANDLKSVPPQGIRSINGVGKPGQSVELTSTDASVSIVPNPITNSIDLSAGVGSTGLLLTNVPCDSTVYVSSFVYLSGGTAFLALADTWVTSNVAGLVVEKPTITTCTIRVSGLSAPLFLGLDESKEYFLSSTVPGGISTTAPSSPGNIALLLGQPFSTTQFIVNKGTRMTRA
jgi:hypothetical protein